MENLIRNWAEINPQWFSNERIQKGRFANVEPAFLFYAMKEDFFKDAGSEPESEFLISGYYPLPQPGEISPTEREDGMGAYLMMFASWAAGLPLPIINLIAAVIYYFVNRKKSPFVHFHCAQSLFSQIPVSLCNASVVFWTFQNLIYNGSFSSTFFNYLLMVVLFNIVYIIVSLIAAVRAKQGRMYYIPFFGRLSFELAFKMVRRTEPKKPSNRPPV